MPEANNPLQAAFFAQAAGISPDQYAKILSAQQQQQMAQALETQGITPISTEGRSIGGVGYKISPWEGAAKLAQALTGGIESGVANQKLANALIPQAKQVNPATGAVGGDNISGQALPQQGGQTGGLNGLNLPPGAGLNMDEALKASFGNYYANVRPGSTYRNPRTGQMTVAPTNEQTNLMPMGGNPQSPQINPITGGPMGQPSPGAAVPVAQPTPQAPPQINASTLQPNTPAPPMPQLQPPPAIGGGIQPGDSAASAMARLNSAQATSTKSQEAQVEQRVKAQDILAGTAGVNENFDKLEQIIKSYPTSTIAPAEAALGNVPGVDSSASIAKAQMDQMVNATLLPQIKTMLQGTGQVRVPEINFLKELHNIQFSNKPEVNLATLGNLRTMVANESTAALSKAGYNAAQGMPSEPAMQPYPTGAPPSAQAIVDQLRLRGHQIQ